MFRRLHSCRTVFFILFIMKRYLLRYGVFAILFLLFSGTLYIMNRLQLRTKQPVSIVCLDGECRAYVAASSWLPHSADTLRVVQTPHGELCFTIDSVTREPSSTVLHLRPAEGMPSLQARLRGDTFFSGFVFVGQERLCDVVMAKMGMN